MKQHRILVLTNSLKSGGAEKQSILLTIALKKKHTVTLVCFNTKNNHPNLIDLVEKKQADIKFIEGTMLVKAWLFFSYLIKEKPTIVFSYLAFTNFLNAVLGKLTSVKFRIGGIRNSQHSKPKLVLQRWLHNYLLTASISNSYSGKKNVVADGYKPETIAVIPNRFVAKSQLLQRPLNTEVTILTVGRFVEQKNYPGILKAIKNCVQNNNNIRLVIVGYGPLESEIRNSIAAENLGENVEIIINPLNIDEYYRKADIYISASFFEGLSNSIMEAMSYSLPVIATRAGDNDTLVIDGETGFLVGFDTDEISSRLLLLTSDHALRNTMGEKSYHHLSKFFSEQAFEERYLKLIEDEFKT